MCNKFAFKGPKNTKNSKYMNIFYMRYIFSNSTNRPQKNLRWNIYIFFSNEIINTLSWLTKFLSDVLIEILNQILYMNWKSTRKWIYIFARLKYKGIISFYCGTKRSTIRVFDFRMRFSIAIYDNRSFNEIIFK